MGYKEDQEAKEAAKAAELAADRVARRERLGHQAAPEPALEDKE